MYTLLVQFTSFICVVNQILPKGIVWDVLFADEADCMDYTPKGVGRGHSKSGVRKTKPSNKEFFAQNLFQVNLNQLGETEFAAKFAGCSPDDVMHVWNKIKSNVMQPMYESESHALNKYLLWLEKLR